jgi:protein O-mannosyl-transferase
MPQRRERHWLPAVASAALALALYAITLGGTYVFDDRQIILFDTRMAGPSHWGQFWTKDYFNGGVDNLYRPLVSMTFALQTHLHGNAENRAWLFHLINVLLHAGVSATLAEFTRRVSSSRIALIAGLLFAAHPIHVEAVANIVGRSELMCALGIIGALTLAMRRPLTIARTVAIWCCFVIALLSKEQGMLVPAVLLAAWFIRPGVTREGEAPAEPSRGELVSAGASPSQIERIATLILILLLAWTLPGYIVFRESILKFWWERGFLDWTINPLVKSEGSSRFLQPLALFGRYIALLIAPVQLSLDYGAMIIMPQVRSDDYYLYIGAAAALAWLVAFVIALLRRALLLAFCLLSFGLFYGVVSNLTALIGIDFAERLIYIPSMFFVIIVAAALTRLRRRLMITLTSILLILASARTVTYAAQWNDRLTLYQTSLARQPNSIRLHLLLAEELRNRRNYDEAERVLAEAREMLPDYYRLWLDSAVLAYTAGRDDDARRFILKAADLRPSIRSSTLYRQILTASTRPTSSPWH